MMMQRTLALATIGLTGLLAGGASLRAQEAARTPPPPLPARVDVVISRTQGDKKVSSLGYTLMPTANQSNTSLRVGVDVPIGTTTTTRPPDGGREGYTTTKPSYQNVGTNIDCRVGSLPDGRFSVYVSVNDTSIFTTDSEKVSIPRVADPTAFRMFSASNTLTMKDGQTMLLTTATDKVTGELLKVEVTFTVLK